MSDGNGSGGGVGCLVVVIALIGGGLLYQREGGKIFGPDGLFAGNPPKQEPPPPPKEITSFNATLSKGLLSHDLLVTNQYQSELNVVDATFTLYRENGTIEELKKFWDTWSPGEVKTISVLANRYQKIEMKGWAIDLPEDKTASGGYVSVKSSWTWTW